MYYRRYKLHVLNGAIRKNASLGTLFKAPISVTIIWFSRNFQTALLHLYSKLLVLFQNYRDRHDKEGFNLSFWSVNSFLQLILLWKEKYLSRYILLKKRKYLRKIKMSYTNPVSMSTYIILFILHKYSFSSNKGWTLYIIYFCWLHVPT